MDFHLIPVKIFSAFGKDFIPQYETDGAVACDLKAAKNMVIQPKHKVIVPTGLWMELPPCYQFEIRPRSGKSLKTGLSIANSPGTIDPDYRGEIGIIVHNVSDQPLKITMGEKIAQGILSRVPRADWVVVDNVDDLSDTNRGDGGFGSTDKPKNDGN